jgi:predicted TIM-barrel enzyme
MEMSHSCYADDVNVLGGSVYVVNNSEAVVVAGKETGQEMNAGNIKYLVISREQSAG